MGVYRRRFHPIGRRNNAVLFRKCYFVDNETTCPPAEQTGLDWEHAWESLLCDGFIYNYSNIEEHYVYVKATDTPYLGDPWGIFNGDTGLYSVQLGHFFFNATGNSLELGTKKAVITGRKNYTGYSLVSGTRYQITGEEIPAFRTGLGSVWGGDLPVGSRGVWVNDIPLVSVADVDAVSTGTYYYNSSTYVLTFDAGVVPTDVKITFALVGLEMNCLGNQAQHVHSAIIEYFKQGTSNGSCSGWTLTDCEIKNNLLDGCHNQVGNIIRCSIHHNGRCGVNEYSFPMQSVVSSEIYANGSHGISVNTPATGAYTTCILNNTLHGNDGYGLSVERIGTSPAVAVTIIAQNNISIGNTLGQFYCEDDAYLILTASNNCPGMINMYGGKWEANKGTGNIELNPLFTDEANNDFRIISSSPVIDAGVDLSASMDSVDIIGTSRPQGAAWDIGAFEFVASGGAAISLLAAITGSSSTPDIAATLARALTANIAGSSSTPDISATVSRLLAASILGASDTPDITASGVGQIMLAAAIAGVSMTPDISATTTRELSAVMAGESSTQDISSTTARELMASITGVSELADIAATVERRIFATISAISQTPDIAAIIERKLSASIDASSFTPEVHAAVSRVLAAYITGASATPDDITVSLNALGELIDLSIVLATVRRTMSSVTPRRTIIST